MSNQNWTTDRIPDLTGKVTIVTGANTSRLSSGGWPDSSFVREGTA